MSGIKKTLGALRDLKDGLKFTGATKGIEDINGAAKRFSLQGMSDSLDSIQSKFSIFGAIGFSVLQRLTNDAIDFGKQIAGAILDPLIEGGKTRALNIEQAKFQFQGLGMDVEQSMDDALYAVKGTAFGLDEAAVAASQFGASGVQSGEEMKAALLGISGVAAMSGSSYTDMANVFTKVAGQGRLMGDDLNRLGTRGINAAATLAEFFNKTSEGANLTEADIREMVTRGEIDFATFSQAMSETFGEHATKANETYTGSLANMRAAISRIGASFFTPKFEAMRRVFNALTPVIDAVADALAPLVTYFERSSQAAASWAEGFLGNLNLSWLKIIMNPIVQVIDNLSRAGLAMLKIIGGALSDVFPAVTGERIFQIVSAIRDFTAQLILAGPTAEKVRRTLAGFFAIFGIAWEVIKAVGVMLADVFGEIFKGSGVVLDATANFGDFLVSILEAIRAGDGLEKFFGRVGTVIKTAVGWIKEFGTFLKDALGNLFDLDFGVAGAGIDGLTSRFKPLQLLIDGIQKVWRAFIDNSGDIGGMLLEVGSAIGGIFSSIGSYLYDAFSHMDYDAILDSINTGLLAGLVLLIKKFLGGFSLQDLMEGEPLGLIESMKSAFGGLTDALDQMQTTLKVGTLLMIAGAVALLTASLIALALVDSEDMAKGLAGITVMMGQLIGAMALMNGINIANGAVRLIILAGGMIVLSVAINILASAVNKMSDLDWQGLAKGLVGVLGLILAMSGAVQLMSGHAGGMITAGLGLILVAAAIRILVGAVDDFADLNWNEIAKGLVGVAGLLTALGLFTKFGAINKAGILSGAGILLLAAGIKLLVSAAQDMAKLKWKDIGKGLASIGGLLGAIALFTRATVGGASLILTGAGLLIVANALDKLSEVLDELSGMTWEEIARGLVALGGALVILAGAMHLMNGTIFGAAALYVVAEALSALAPAIENMGGMTWDEIARGLVTLAGSLTVIALAMMFMTGALPGAAALYIVSAALGTLGPVLVELGQMSWSEVLTSLVALAAALTILGLAGLLLTPVVPTLLGLGIAVGLLGLGMALAGAGVLLFATGLTALAVAGTLAAGAFIAFVAAIASAIPMILEAAQDILVGILNIIIDTTPLIGTAIETLIREFLRIIIALTPEIGAAFSVILTELLRIVEDHGPDIQAAFLFILGLMLTAAEEAVPDMVQAGINILIAFLEGIEENMNSIVATVVRIITTFLDALADQMPLIVNSGINLIISFVNGLAEGIRDNTEEMRAAGWNLAMAIIDGMTGGLASGEGRVATAARSVAKGALGSAMWYLGIRSPSREFFKLGEWIDQGLADGMNAHVGVVNNASKNVGREAIDSMRKTITGLSDILDAEMDVTPQISPVLDLSNIEKGSKRISGLLSSTLSLQDAAQRAYSAEAAYRSNEAAFEEAQDLSSEPREVNYIQNNHSPKALSSAEIYRHTKNQLSLMKGV